MVDLGILVLHVILSPSSVHTQHMCCGVEFAHFVGTAFALNHCCLETTVACISSQPLPANCVAFVVI